MKMPYRSRLGSGSRNFTDFASYRAENCAAGKRTNGYNLYDEMAAMELEDVPSAAAYFQQQPPVNTAAARKHALNVILDATPPSDIDLPEELQPKAQPLNESYSVAQFYLLDDKKTGVLALGSFSAQNFSVFQSSLLAGLKTLKKAGAEQLIVDVVS